jgi:hypothetical protein
MEIPRSRPIDQKRIQGLYDRAGTPLESADIWYLHSTLCQCFLPYKDPKTDTWERRNGDFSIAIVAGHVRDPRSDQTASRFPFRWCGMEPTVSGISQLDAPPRLPSAQEEALDTSEPGDANPRRYANPIQPACVRTGVDKIMTRFGRASWRCAALPAPQVGLFESFAP